MAETEFSCSSLVTPQIGSACVFLTMDGMSAGQDGLLEVRSSSDTSACAKGPLKLPDSLELLDQQDRAPRVTVEVNRASSGEGSLHGLGQDGLCQNGPALQLSDPPLPLDPTTSPVGPDAPPGVAGFHDNLRKSQGTSAEGSVRKEALQSLRLSLPMQETQLCKHLFPWPFPPSARQGHQALRVHALTTYSEQSWPSAIFLLWWALLPTRVQIHLGIETFLISGVDGGAKVPSVEVL